MSNSIENLTLKIGSFPILSSNSTVYDSISLMNKHKLGTVCIADEDLHLQGIFTDGDLRRIFLKIQKPLSAILIDDISIYMNKNPFRLNLEDNLSKEDIKLVMKKNKIWDIPIIKGESLYGMVHLHNLLDE